MLQQTPAHPSVQNHFSYSKCEVFSHIYRAFQCETAVVRTNEVRQAWDRPQETFYKHLEPTFPDPIHQTIKSLYLLVDTQ